MTGDDSADRTSAPGHAPRGVGAILVLSALTFAGVLLWMLVRGMPDPALNSDSPERMLSAMTDMVREGTPGRLVELVEIAPPGVPVEERQRWNALAVRLGRVLDAAWELAEAMGAAFPDEIAELRERAVEDGLGTLLMAGRPGGRDQGERFTAILRGVLADPFSTLERGAERISFEELSDDEVAVLVDGNPVLPPVGLTARRGDDGRWRVVLPTSSPFLTRYLPNADPEFAVFASILATAENLLLELERDVRAGRFESVEDVSDAAVRRAVLPVGMAFAALDRARRGEDASDSGGSP